MSETIKVSATYSVSPKQIYNAWLNSKEHTLITGGKATASTKVGSKFTAWNGYISGKNIELVKKPHCPNMAGNRFSRKCNGFNINRSPR